MFITPPHESALRRFLIYRQLWGDFGLKYRQNRHKTGLNYNRSHVCVTMVGNKSVLSERRDKMPYAVEAGHK